MVYKETYFINDGQKLRAYLNDQNELFISITSNDDEFTAQFITLDAEDLCLFIDYLQGLYKDQTSNE